jgi:hypothetical protein
MSYELEFSHCGDSATSSASLPLLFIKPYLQPEKYPSTLWSFFLPDANHQRNAAPVDTPSLNLHMDCPPPLIALSRRYYPGTQVPIMDLWYTPFPDPLTRLISELPT